MKILLIAINVFLLCFNMYALNLTIVDIKTEEGTSIYNTLLADKANIRAIFVGDIMLSRFVSDIVKKNGGDYRYLFEKIEPFLKDSDIVFGNLENPVTDTRFRIKDNISVIAQYPIDGLITSLTSLGSPNSFSAEEQSLSALSWAGFNVVSIANNHIGDAGIKGIEDTIINLQKNGIAYIGGGLNKSEAHKPFIFEKNNIRIGIIGYLNVKAIYKKNTYTWAATENKAGIAIFDEKNVKKDIDLIKPLADIIIVSMHTGNEGDISPDNRDIKTCRYLIDEGANIFIGHHPHVVQPLEVYKNGLIAYSLGNFIFDSDSYEHTNGLLLELFIKNKSTIYVIPRNIIINYSHQPTINAQ